MSDLISRKEFLKRIEPYNTEDKMDKALYNFAHNKMIDCSSSEPERKHGKWVENKWGEETCSECGYIHKAEGSNFCPNCGAKIGVDE